MTALTDRINSESSIFSDYSLITVFLDEKPYYKKYIF